MRFLAFKQQGKIKSCTKSAILRNIGNTGKILSSNFLDLKIVRHFEYLQHILFT